MTKVKKEMEITKTRVDSPADYLRRSLDQIRQTVLGYVHVYEADMNEQKPNKNNQILLGRQSYERWSTDQEDRRTGYMMDKFYVNQEFNVSDIKRVADKLPREEAIKFNGADENIRLVEEIQNVELAVAQHDAFGLGVIQAAMAKDDLETALIVLNARPDLTGHNSTMLSINQSLGKLMNNPILFIDTVLPSLTDNKRAHGKNLLNIINNEGTTKYQKFWTDLKKYRDQKADDISVGREAKTIAYYVTQDQISLDNIRLEDKTLFRISWNEVIGGSVSASVGDALLRFSQSDKIGSLPEVLQQRIADTLLVATYDDIASRINAGPSGRPETGRGWDSEITKQVAYLSRLDPFAKMILDLKIQEFVDKDMINGKKVQLDIVKETQRLAIKKVMEEALVIEPVKEKVIEEVMIEPVVEKLFLDGVQEPRVRHWFTLMKTQDSIPISGKLAEEIIKSINAELIKHKPDTKRGVIGFRKPGFSENVIREIDVEIRAEQKLRKVESIVGKDFVSCLFENVREGKISQEDALVRLKLELVKAKMLGTNSR